MLKGRLGLESARIPHADRHGLMWLGRGSLSVEDGTLRFATAGSPDLPPGDYAIPFQAVSCFLLEPGTTVSHDALRLLSRHGCCLVAVGEGGVRLYASLPAGPSVSARARRHAELWADPSARMQVARRMYAMRFGEIPGTTNLDVLRGIEGARVKEIYKQLASRYGLTWYARKYDRGQPDQADLPNQAINHASSALQAAALTAIAITGALPQLGFIHEDPGHAFALDLSDLFRESVMLPAAFLAVRTKEVLKDEEKLERLVRQKMGEAIRKDKVIPAMIDRIKELIDADDGGGDE